MYKFLFETCFFIFGVYTQVWNGLVIIFYFQFVKEPSDIFHSSCSILYFQQGCTNGSNSSTSFLTRPFQFPSYGYLMILVCIFLVTNHVRNLLTYLLALLYLLWRSVYLHPLLLFKCGIFLLALIEVLYVCIIETQNTSQTFDLQIFSHIL